MAALRGDDGLAGHDGSWVSCLRRSPWVTWPG